MSARGLLWLTLVAAMSGSLPARAEPAREGAWDRSVTLEQAGRVEEARQLLLRAWGDAPESYEVTVRVAWLSLRLGDLARAQAAYERALALPGAGPEATLGLSSTLAAIGYRQFVDGELNEARRTWKSALALVPGHPEAERGLALASRRIVVEPEVWGGYVQRLAKGPDPRGWVVFAQVPWHVTRTLTVRAAYRHMEMSSPGAGAAGFRQHDAYLSGSYEGRWVGAELLGGALLPSDEGTVWLGAGRLRAGRDFGVLAEGALLRREAGFSGQVLPKAFWWPAPSLGATAGARVTCDPLGAAVSGQAGLHLAVPRVRLGLEGHVGPERWPVTSGVPLVLTSADELNLGGTLSGSFGLSQSLWLGVHLQVERLSLSPGQRGVYLSTSAGFRYAPPFEERR